MLNNQEISMPVLIEDLGMQYPKHNNSRKYRYGIFKCFCGSNFVSRVGDIKSGKQNGCGCRLPKRHGYKNHILYKVWSNMMQRISNKNSYYYHNYGGRGIAICERWVNIKNFIEDMLPTYQEGLTLDRIDNDGNYEPSNCRWVSRDIQMQNTRTIMPTNTSGYRGVSFVNSKNKFQTQIRYFGKSKFIGYFDDPKVAAMAYDTFVIVYGLNNTQNFK